MSKRDLPRADVAPMPAFRTGIKPETFNSWRPEVHAADESDKENTISVLDIIGQDWFGEGVTVKRIDAALRSIGQNDVTVNINSPGGDFFEGLAIYNRLREHKAKVTVKVLGMAASAASVIAMAGDEIQIARAGFLMIHNTWIFAVGDRNALIEAANWLKPFDEAAVDVYAARTGLEGKKIAKMLDDETWLNGTRAIEEGFADALLPADHVSNSAWRSDDFQASLAANRVTSLLMSAGMSENIFSGHIEALVGTSDASADEQLVSGNILDTLLNVAKVSRSERRQLLSALRCGKPGAAAHGMQDAALCAEVEGLLASIRNL